MAEHDQKQKRTPVADPLPPERSVAAGAGGRAGHAGGNGLAAYAALGRATGHTLVADETFDTGPQRTGRFTNIPVHEGPAVDDDERTLRAKLEDFTEFSAAQRDALLKSILEGGYENKGGTLGWNRLVEVARHAAGPDEKNQNAESMKVSILAFTRIAMRIKELRSFSDIRIRGRDIHADPARAAQDASARTGSSTGLSLVAESFRYLGVFYKTPPSGMAQTHKEGVLEERDLSNLDCTRFTQTVYSAVTGVTLGSDVSGQYRQHYEHPEKWQIIAGTRAKKGGPDQLERVADDGTRQAGDLGVFGGWVKIVNGKLQTDFKHIVMFTGRKVNGKDEYIHAPEPGTGVQLSTHSRTDMIAVMRPKF